MNAVRVLVLVLVVVVVTVVAGSYALSQGPPEMTAEEARVFTRAALNAIEAQNAVVEGEVRAETFTPEGGEPIQVWVVPAMVSGQPLELYVMRAGDRAVNLDDALPQGGFVLPEEQFEALERFRLDVAGDRVREARAGPALVAGLLLILVGVSLLARVVTGRARAADTDAERG
ncbi:MAG: hypothetical protein M3N15_01350 [Actinomycetota bacterium]|nr:hypothetical protein [Actinomycetota bacterium]